MTNHRFAKGAVAGAFLLIAASSAGLSRDKTEGYPTGYTATGPNGYVYIAPSYQALPPYFPYAGVYSGGYYPPPVGFGSPYYSGYNDPNYRLYGRGVRDSCAMGARTSTAGRTSRKRP